MGRWCSLGTLRALVPRASPACCLCSGAGGLRPGEIAQVTRDHIIPSRLNTVNPDEGPLAARPASGH
eukprot:11436063-Alexandrium_andersonii.AAC.1